MFIEEKKLKELQQILQSVTKEEKTVNLLLLFIDEIIELSTDNNNLKSIEVALRCKADIACFRNDNSKYLSKFMKFLVSVNSKEIKEKMSDVIDAIMNGYSDS